MIFVDLVGFTSRAERLDPEDVRDLLTPYHERVRTEIERFGAMLTSLPSEPLRGLFGELVEVVEVVRARARDERRLETL